MKEPTRLKIQPAEQGTGFEFVLSSVDSEFRCESRLVGVEREAIETALNQLDRAVRVPVWVRPSGRRELVDTLGHAMAVALPDALIERLSEVRALSLEAEGVYPWELAGVAGAPLWKVAPTARTGVLPPEVVGLLEDSGRPRALVVFDADGLGAWAESEAVAVRDALQPRFQVECWRGPQASAARLRDAFSEGRFGLIHLLGYFDPQAGIHLHDGPFDPAQLEKLDSSKKPRLVFLTLAEPVPQPGSLLTPVGRLAEALLRGGVDAVIATGWGGDPHRAAELVARFYAGCLDAGKTVAESLWQARRVCDTSDDPYMTSHSYIACGNLWIKAEDLRPVEVETMASAATIGGAWQADFRLVALEGPEKGLEIPLYAAVLQAGKTITIGGPGPRRSDVRLEDPDLPNQALSLELRDGCLILANLTSDPGAVRLNGLPVVDRAHLEGWEEILLGSSCLRLERAGEPVPARQPAVDLEQDRYTLEVVEGVEQDRERRLTLQDRVVLVGRFRDCSFMVHDPAVSRHHATLVPRGRFYYLAPVGSARVVVNGVPVAEEHELRHDDRIQLSEQTMLRFVDRSRSRS